MNATPPMRQRCRNHAPMSGPVPAVVAAIATTIAAAVGTSARAGTSAAAQQSDPQGLAAAAIGPDLQQSEAMLARIWQAFETGLGLGLQSLPRLGELPQQFAARWREEAGGTGLADYLFSLVLVLAMAAAIGWAARWLTARLLQRRAARHPATAAADDLLARFGICLRRAGADLAGLVVFAVAAVQIGRVSLPGNEFMLLAGRDMLRGILVTMLFVVVARFLLSPSRSVSGAGRPPLLPIPRPGWHFAMWMAYGVLGMLNGTVVLLATRAGADPQVIAGWFLLMVVVLTVQKVWWFWAGRHDIAAALGRDAAAGWWRRIMGRGLPWLLIVIALAIAFAAFMAASQPEAVSWGAAAGTTQLLVILLPIAALGCDAIIGACIDRRQAAATPAPIRVALAVVARQVATGIVWVAGLFVLGRLWRFLLQDMGLADGSGVLPEVVAAGITGWVIWSFLRAYFEAHMPRQGSGLPGAVAEDEDGERKVLGRVASVLPVIRDLAFGAVIVITVLVVLAAMGVDIAPLLAGFGVIGLAISFGSQALVKDIVSGFFFMTDDAFRVGEYIDTGRLKGTVEKISLRSVRLRHQSGQVHTIPFGTLQAITNFSRDWATIKFAIRLDREVDFEKVRKIIKKVGQQMLEQPEFAQEFIMPLKLQGMQEVTETAMIVRCKFTCRPVKPSYLQREALKRIYAALREAGIPLASNAVTVRSNLPGGEADAAAAGTLPAQGGTPPGQ